MAVEAGHVLVEAERLGFKEHPTGFYERLPDRLMSALRRSKPVLFGSFTEDFIDVGTGSGVEKCGREDGSGASSESRESRQSGGVRRIWLRAPRGRSQKASPR